MGRSAQHRGDEPVCRWRRGGIQALCLVRGLYRPDVGLLRRLHLPGEGPDRPEGLPLQPALLAFPGPARGALPPAIPAWPRCTAPGSGWTHPTVRPCCARRTPSLHASMRAIRSDVPGLSGPGCLFGTSTPGSGAAPRGSPQGASVLCRGRLGLRLRRRPARVRGRSARRPSTARPSAGRWHSASRPRPAACRRRSCPRRHRHWHRSRRPCRRSRRPSTAPT